MRFPVNAPKPFFPFLQQYYTIWARMRKIPFGTVAVAMTVLVTSLSVLTVVRYLRKSEEKIDLIRARSLPLMKQIQDPLTDLAPFTSPFKKHN